MYFSTCLWTQVPNRSLVGVRNWSETSSRPSTVTSAQQRASQSCWSLLYVWVVYMLFSGNLSRIFVEKLFQDSYRDWTCKKHLKHSSSTLDPNRCFVQYMSFSQKNMHEHVYTDTHIFRQLVFSPWIHVFRLFARSKGIYIYIYATKAKNLASHMHACMETYIRTHTHRHKYIQR